MKPGTRKHLVAWLGLMAMLLISFVPLASQLVAANSISGDHMICSTAGDSAPAHATDMSQADACGYCSFFDHYASLPTSFAAPDQFLRVVVTLAIATTPTAPALLAQYPTGRPRAPPEML